MPSQQFCTFLLDGYLFGVPVPRVQELIRFQEMTRVPLAPEVVEGMINLRGQIVVAIDLRRRFALSERAEGELPINVVVRKLDARVPILMFSTLTERGASATLEALALGATDYLTKPSNTDMAATSETVTRELLSRIRALCHLPVSLTADAGTQGVPLAPPLAVRPKRKPPLIAPVQIVTIGVSTGGPDALARLLPSLPANLPVPVVIAQHMPPIFTSLLAARLSARCSLPVRECKSGENLTAGCVFIAPGDFHMVTCSENGAVRLKTHQGPKENLCRPSVDVLFRSVANVYGARTLAVILTGMGQDGLKGCELLSSLGARILVQDEASSVVWGMPGLVARSGLADKILPLDQIGAEIVRATTMQIAARAQS